MPRRPRGLITNTFAHITARGNRDVPIFERPHDFPFFLDLLRDYSVAMEVKVHAYCLMTNHLHLLLEVGCVPISKLMHVLLLRYAKYINRAYQHRGHLFADRFWVRPVTWDGYLLVLLRYIHLNPVRAGLVERPEQYAWSSHRIYLELSSAPWVSTTTLDLFAQDRPRAQDAYARFVAEGIPRRKPAKDFPRRS